jgi:hypothetical protein
MAATSGSRDRERIDGDHAPQAPENRATVAGPTDRSADIVLGAAVLATGCGQRPGPAGGAMRHRLRVRAAFPYGGQLEAAWTQVALLLGANVAHYAS